MACGRLNESEIAPSLLTHVHYSRRYRYLYVDTPKTGCSTIKYILQRAERRQVEDVRNPTRNNPYGYSDFLIEVHDRKRSLLRWPNDAAELGNFVAAARVRFCFVRNPFSRIVSAYVDKIASNAARRTTFLSELGFVQEEAARPISFVEFLRLVARQEPTARNPHWRGQRHHLMMDSICYDFVGAFEHFSADLERILARIDREILRYLATVDEHRTGSEQLLASCYKDAEAVRLVRDTYEEDFRQFGYSDDPSHALKPPE